MFEILNLSCDIMEIIMEFLSWHYSKGIDYYFQSAKRSLAWILHYFSLGLLLKTLFAPWKRVIVVDTTPGFNLQKRFEALTFNLISRGIGVCVRFILFWFGIILIVLTLLGSAVGFLFWLILPFFGLPVFSKYKKNPQNFVNELISKINEGQVDPLETIFASEAGSFVLSHTGLTREEIIQNAQGETNFENFDPKAFSEIVEKLLKDNVWREEFFNKRGLLADDLILAAKWWDEVRSEYSKMGQEEFSRPGIALELTFGYTPTLNKYSVDLSTPQPFSHRLIGRREIVERMERVLTSGMSVMLTGAPGVGKKTVVLEFAKKAAGGVLGRQMVFKRVLELDYNSILSEAVDLNQKKVSLAQIFSEAAGAGNIILMIKDIHRLTNAEVEGYDFTDIFDEYLEGRALKIIAVSTNTDYERFIVPNLRIRKFLERVEITPSSKNEALQIIVDAAKRWERLTGLTITVPALRHIIEESDKYVTEIPFPEKALELLDAVVTYAQKVGSSTITVDDTNAVLAEKIGISFAKLTQVEKKRLENIEETIHKRLIGQDSAIALIGATLRAKTVGIIKEERPLGSFLFLGPTGVGKTETAKVLAKVYYGAEANMIRFDMAEYSGAEGLERLIGSVSRNLPGALTTAIKNRPASLLLLDEIEKASKEIYDIFLSLLDEGVITDAFGKKIICKHLFVIGTSNAGAEYIRGLVNKGVSGEELQRRVVNFVLEKEIFSPEFLNRFDGVVVYEPLSEDELVRIAKLMLSDLADGLKSKNITLLTDEEVAKKLAREGYDPAFGARPMKRILNIDLGDLIGKALLRGEIREGDKIRVIAGYAKEEFKLEKIR